MLSAAFIVIIIIIITFFLSFFYFFFVFILYLSSLFIFHFFLPFSLLLFFLTEAGLNMDNELTLFVHLQKFTFMCLIWSQGDHASPIFY